MLPLALDIELSALALGVPAPLSLDIDVTSGDGPPIVYRDPPRFLLSTGVAAASADVCADLSERLGWSDAYRRDRRAELLAADASQHTDAPGALPWNATRVVDSRPVDAPWSTPAPLAGRSGMPETSTTPVDVATGATWDASIAQVDTVDAVVWSETYARDSLTGLPLRSTRMYWSDPKPAPLYLPTALALRHAIGGSLGAPVPLALDMDLTSSDLILQGPFRAVDGTVTAPGITPEITDTPCALPWDTSGRQDRDLNLPVITDPLPPPEPPPAPEIKDAYLIMNNAYIVTLPERTPVSAQDISISLDLDAFVWSLSARILDAPSMALLRPGPTGPVHVEVGCNGHAWVFIIERYSQEHAFPARSWRIQGVSRTQYLASPYAPRRTARITVPTNARGVITDQLLYTGFDHTWDAELPDYTIPADVWGYERKTPMEVISEIAGAVGAVIVPDPMTDTLHIQHRYRAGQPWSWDALPPASLDVIVAEALVGSLSAQWTPGAPFNAVHLSGITAGVAVDVIRTGTAGDEPAADVIDALNVSTAQCRARGRAILGESGNQEVVTLTLPLMPSGPPGLITPGMLLEHQSADPDRTWRGLVLSTRVDIAQPGASRVSQTIQIERHH